MKIRTGYVSNSSSASFIIKWKSKNNREMTLEQALDVMDNDYMFGNGMTKNELKEVTKDIGDGRFKTEFYTTMMNSADDFGEVAKSFVINVMTSDYFEIFDYEIDSDNG